MNVTDLLGLLGGLALFLYGMQMMSAGLEDAAGNRMKQILERLTANRFLGVAVGAGITAVIQSSSATTVMVVGFVNSGMMTLKQAVWIIMGANIGTTITGQLIALDVGALAPLFAFVGVVFIVFVKKVIFHHYGQIIAGLGILFIGMEMMSSAMMPLRDSAAFVDLVSNFSNPFIGILAGAVFTALIQSSSASVGILQALAVSGVIGLPTAVYVLFGQNIGTCVTAMMACAGTTKTAKRTATVHLLFNVLGATMFTIITLVTPFTDLVKSISPDNVMMQISIVHIFFNIVTTAILLPLSGYLVKLACRIIPGEDRQREALRLKYLDQRILNTPPIAVVQVLKEVERMGALARENFLNSMEAIRTPKSWKR